MRGLPLLIPVGVLVLLVPYLFLLKGDLLKFGVGVLVVLGMGLAFMVPEIALQFFIFFSTVSVAVVPGYATVAKMAGMVCSLAFLATILSKRASFKFGGFSSLLMLWLFLIICLSTLKARNLNAALFGVMTVAFSMVAYLLFINIVNTPEKFRRILNVVLLAVTANSVLAIYEFFVLGMDRAEGLIGQANQLGYICAFSLPFCYGFITETRGFKKLIYYLATFLILLGLISSASRAAFLAFIISLFLFTLRGRGRALVFMLVPLAIYLFWLSPFIPSRYWERMRTILSGEGPERSSLDNPRIFFLKAGLKMWIQNPVLGVGINNFQSNYAHEFNPGYRRGEEPPSHSLYVQTLAETGTLGMISLMALLGWCFFTLQGFRRRARESLSIEAKKYLFSLEVGFLVFLFISNFSGGLLHYWNYLIVGMIVSLRNIFYLESDAGLMASSPEKSEEHPPNLKSPEYLVPQ